MDVFLVIVSLDKLTHRGMITDQPCLKRASNEEDQIRPTPSVQKLIEKAKLGLSLLYKLKRMNNYTNLLVSLYLCEHFA